MMKVPSLGGTKNIIRKDSMRVIKDLDPADSDCEKLLAKGHLVKGITLCAEDNPDLFCVTREQRSTRDLVDRVVIQAKFCLWKRMEMAGFTNPRCEPIGNFGRALI
jgi:hypothetical protein